MRESLFWCIFCEFCETCNITFFAEQRWTTASEYSGINSSEGVIVLVKETVNYDIKTKAYVLICARSAIYQKGHPRQKNTFLKQSFADLKLRLLKNFVNSTGKHLCRNLFLIKLLTSCNSIKKRLQHSFFPVKFAEFLRTPFVEKSSSGSFWGLSRAFKGVLRQKPVRLSAIITRFSWKKVSAAAKSKSSHRRCSVKEGL